MRNESYATTTAPARSPIAVLSGVIEHNAAYENSVDKQGTENEILTIWLPVFRSKANLTMALDCLRLSYEGQIEGDICSFYLCVLEGINDEVL
jgi:hypothetical protein